MFGIFCYFYDKPNLIYPYYVIGVKVDEDKRAKLYQLLNSLLNLNKLNFYSKSDYNKVLVQLRVFNRVNGGIRIYLREIGKLEIEKYGIRKAFYNEVNYLSNFYPEETILAGCCSSSFNYLPNGVIYSSQYNQNLELSIGFIYSKFIRLNHLSKYHKEYPSLRINKHKGDLSKLHFSKLLELKALPYFYIETEVIQHLLTNREYKVLPSWAETYIKNNYANTIR